MQTQAAKDQRAYRRREKAKLAAELDNLIDDVDVIVTKPKDGKQIITFDMGRQTAEALELVAAAQGKNLDEILRGVITKNLKEAARLKMVKDSHERRAQIAAVKADLVKSREEQAALQAEIAKYEAGK